MTHHPPRKWHIRDSPNRTLELLGVTPKGDIDQRKELLRAHLATCSDDKLVELALVITIGRQYDAGEVDGEKVYEETLEFYKAERIAGVPQTA